MRMPPLRFGRLATLPSVGAMAYRLCLAAEFFAGFLAVMITVMTVYANDTFEPKMRSGLQITMWAFLALKSFTTSIYVVARIGETMFEHPSQPSKALPVIVSAAGGMILSTLALLIAFLIPYEAKRADTFHFGKLITYQCSHGFTATDSTGAYMESIASDYTELQNKCFGVRVTVVATVIFFSFQVLVLLSPLRLLFVRPVRTRNPRSLAPGNRTGPIELVRFPTTDDDEPAAPAGATAGATVQRDVRSSDEETRSGSFESVDLDQISPRPSLSRQRSLRLSFDSDELPMIPQPRQDEEQRRSRSTALSSEPTRPIPAAVRGVSRRGRSRRLTPTVEEAEEEYMTRAVPLQEFSPLNSNHFEQPH